MASSKSDVEAKLVALENTIPLDEASRHRVADTVQTLACDVDTAKAAISELAEFVYPIGVINRQTGVLHAANVDRGIIPSLWATSCGWAWASSRVALPAVSTLKFAGEVKPCVGCRDALQRAQLPARWAQILG